MWYDRCCAELTYGRLNRTPFDSIGGTGKFTTAWDDWDEDRLLHEFFLIAGVLFCESLARII